MNHILSYKLFEYKENPTEIVVNSYDELLNLLKEYNIPLEKWGTGGFKTVEHLWGEIEDEECTLTEKDGQLNRDVDFVGTRIIYKKDGKNYRLWEDRAEFKDGRIRIRPIPHSMAEKFKHGEDPVPALIRGMEEELGIKLNKNQFAFYNKDRFENNGDYPGIRSYHNGYYYFIVLNDEQFNPDGYIENQKDKTIYFVWRELKPRAAGHYPMPLGADKVKF